MTGRQMITRRRLRICLAAVIAMFVLFAARLFQIQAFDTSAYAAMASKAGERSTVIPATRGEILDRNGEPLATSVAGTTLIADPKLSAENAPQIAQILSDTLGDKIDYFTAIEQLRTPNSRYVYLVKDLPAWEAKEAVNATREAGLSGVFTESVDLRTYPGGQLAANLLGYLNAEGDGVAGLEQMFNERLSGTDGSTSQVVSPTGQVIPLADSKITEMVPGDTVTTTIDRDLQWFADNRLAQGVQDAGADWGLAITMDVRTCQIVQMSQAPTFNADTREGMTESNTVARSFQTVFEPGSVMKTITMAALADQGKIAPDTPISVPGGMVIDKYPIGDYWDHGELHLTAAGVIAKSSNLGTIVAAQQMSDEVMHDYLSRFGFGKKTGVGLAGESRGLLSDPSTWTKANHATISFGQGISVTALQVVRAVGAIANGGTMCSPTVVQSFESASGERTAPEVDEAVQVVSSEAARAVTTMMEAVTADNGTAPAAQIEGYRVAGKTGTAWRVSPETGTYVRGQNTVSFIGFAPADAPRFLTYIVLDKPHANAGGGSSAAPVFHDIMSMALERFGVTPTGSPVPEIAQEW